MVASDNTRKQLLAVLFSHSIIVKLITSQLLSQIYSTTLVIVVYDRDTVLQVVHNRGHGFQKVLTRPGCTNSNTHTIDLGKNQIKTQRGFHDKAITGFRNISGGHPIKLPATKLADSETDSRFVWTAVNDREPKSVTGLVDTAKTCHDPKQYRCSSHTRK